LFSTALKSVEKYTLPVILSKRLANGSINSGCGSFIVVNSDGWILTAAHIIHEAIIAQQHAIARGEYDVRCQAIESDSSLTIKQKRKERGRLAYNPEWIVNHSFWWGGLPALISNFMFDSLADLAIGRLEPFDAAWISDYPVFKNPAENMPSGTSLCRLGYPFHAITATYDQATDRFTLGPGVLPVPRFPNDGIHTRLINMLSPDGSRQASFIETSTPGLRGQSGGPIFDKNGHVWALQSQTNSLELGFTPTVKQGNKEIVEHQFMHVGWGSHVANIIKIFRDHNVAFAISS